MPSPPHHALLSPSVSHNDFAFQLRKLHSNRLSQIDLHNVTALATDISRLHAGHVQAQVRSFIHVYLFF